MPPQEEINLELLPISELTAHEETVPHLSDRLAHRMIRDGVQRDPIVVDGKSMIVLDGMHRLLALKRMGARYAVSYVIDYMSEDVKLFRWFRFVENPGERLVSDMQDELGMHEEVPLSWADSGFDSTNTLSYAGRAYKVAPGLAGGEEEVDLKLRAIRTFDAVATRAGGWIEYVDESTASPDLLKGDYLALLTSRFRKEDVTTAGSREKRFPPKSTLHVFPVRPMGINYPLEALRSRSDMLEKMVATRPRRRIEPPSFYRGRLYREPVVVFE